MDWNRAWRKGLWRSRIILNPTGLAASAASSSPNHPNPHSPAATTSPTTPALLPESFHNKSGRSTHNVAR